MKYCTQCNCQNDDNALFCRQCGAKLPETVPYAAQMPTQQTAQQAQNNYTPPQQHYIAPLQTVANKPKKKGKGCLIGALVAVGVVVLLFFLMVIFAPSEPEYVEEPAVTNGADVSENLTLDTTVPDQQTETDPTSQNTAIGSYGVQIKEWKIVKANDADILIVTYIFSNYSSSARSFTMSIYDRAFQQGIEASKEFVLWDYDDFDAASDDKDVQPGYSLEVQEAYHLNDTTSPVEIEIKEGLTLFADDVLHFTINIAE